MARVRPLRIEADWDSRFSWTVGVSALVHLLLFAAFIVLGPLLASRAMPPTAYTVELTDGAGLGGRLPRGLTTRKLGAPAPAKPKAPAAPPLGGPTAGAQPEPPKTQPAPAPEPPPAAADAKPAPPPEPPKPEEPKVEAKAEPPPTIPEPKPVPQPAPEAKVPPPKPEPKPEAKVEPKPPPPPKPEPKPEAKPEPKPQPKPEAKAPPKPEANAKPEPPKADAKPAAKPDAKADAKPAPTTDTKPPAANPADGKATAEKAEGAKPAATPGKPDGKAAAAGAAAHSGSDDPYLAAASRWKTRGEGGGVPNGDDGDGPLGMGGDGRGGGQVMGLEFLAYVRQVETTVREQWVRVVDQPGLFARVGIQINPDGSLTNVHLVKSSGSQPFDTSVMRAVQRIGVLPPPPTRYQADFQTKGMILNFHSDEREGQGAG